MAPCHAQGVLGELVTVLGAVVVEQADHTALASGDTTAKLVASSCQVAPAAGGIRATRVRVSGGSTASVRAHRDMMADRRLSSTARVPGMTTSEFVRPRLPTVSPRCDWTAPR